MKEGEVRRIKESDIPELKSFEEEREYWEARGPLAAGRRGTLNKPTSGLTKSSFLSIRLTGAELDRLYEISKERGVGPSTFARMVLTSVIEQHDRPKATFTFEQLCELVFNTMPQALKDRFEAFGKDAQVPDFNSPSFLILDPKQVKELESLSMNFMEILLSKLGVRLITPEKQEYQKVKDAIEEKA